LPPSIAADTSPVLTSANAAFTTGAGSSFEVASK
jgi:hypothetical protein